MRYGTVLRRGGPAMPALLLGLLLFRPAAVQPAAQDGGGRAVSCEGSLYVVPLRIHGGGSSRTRRELERVREEINRIWGSQAGICFAGEIVAGDEPLPSGMDIWFVPFLDGFNGYYAGPDAIRVRDFPELRPAASPSADGAARTAAHEIGHGLGLVHRQDSAENLMRSKTFGWRLDAEEAQTARRAAASLATGEAAGPGCPPCPGESGPP